MTKTEEIKILRGKIQELRHSPVAKVPEGAVRYWAIRKTWEGR
jgi:hypothetical protein